MTYGNRGSALSALGLIALAGVAQAGAPRAADVLYDALPDSDRIIVMLRDSGASAAAGADTGARLQSVLRGLGLDAGVISERRRLATGAEVFGLGAGSGVLMAERIVASLSRHPDVRYAERDHLRQRQLVPNDPLHAAQWHYYETAGGLNLAGAWDRATGAGSVVAVVDTGYRPHVDLAANLLPGYDFISDPRIANDGDGRDADARDPGDWIERNSRLCRTRSFIPSSWHGTHVSGTVAALTDNGLGVAGVAFGARLLPLRVLGTCGGYDSDIADAVVWAAGGAVPGVPANPYPADVINLSLGGSGRCGNTMQAAINQARARGTTVVVAAGNADVDARNATPASCTGVVVVAATGRAGERAPYSNYGPAVDVAAPGGSGTNGVISTLNDGERGPARDVYAAYQGTSMAAPHVAAVAALLRQVRQGMSPDQIECVLRATARPFPATPTRPIGSGIVDAEAAVVAALAVELASPCGGGAVGEPDPPEEPTDPVVPADPADPDPPADTRPDAFAFVDVADALGGQTYVSNVITVTGTNAPAALDLRSSNAKFNAAYSVNEGAYQTGATEVLAGDSVRLRVMAPAISGKANVTVTLRIGGVSGSWNVQKPRESR